MEMKSTMLIYQDQELGATFSKLLRKILGRFLILGKSLENIRQSTILNCVIIAQ